MFQLYKKNSLVLQQENCSSYAWKLFQPHQKMIQTDETCLRAGMTVGQGTGVKSPPTGKVGPSWVREISWVRDFTVK